MLRIRSGLVGLRNRLRGGSPVYPPIEPFAVCHLRVDAVHELYVEQCGNPSGIPVVFLHGGPGAGCNPYNRRFFDPRRYHIILYDQRGAGRSLPYASLHENTTQHLVSDLETLREHLQLEAWVLFGGSWGATLALLYAQRFPERVLGLILRGIFLCRDRDVRWFFEDGARRLLPEQWDAFCSPVPASERSDMLAAYRRLLTCSDEATRIRAAMAWSAWEGCASTLLPSPSQAAYFADPQVAVCMSQIECHYFLNRGFLENDQILRDSHRLRGIPGTIVHGRYDLVCPLEAAWELHRAWPESRLQVIEAAGHSATEHGLSRALVAATRRHADDVQRAGH